MEMLYMGMLHILGMTELYGTIFNHATTHNDAQLLKTYEVLISQNFQLIFSDCG